MIVLKWYITEQEAGTLVRDFLRSKGISRAALTDIKFHGGNITVGGAQVTVRHMLQARELLQVTFPPEQRSDRMESESIPLHIVYEDEYVLVINKEPNMSSIPSREHPHGTVANALLHHYDQQHLESTVHIVTRLDRDTSGLLLIAKNRFIHHAFAQQQQIKSIVRTYEALVHGVVTEDEGTIYAPIARKGESIIERMVSPSGQQAITHFRVIERLPNCTWVALRLETGRTHQIRVHMAHIGHPLVGDDLYGGDRKLINRQALHSTSLTFYHPMLNEKLSFTCLVPADMQAAIEKERATK